MNPDATSYALGLPTLAFAWVAAHEPDEWSNLVMVAIFAATWAVAVANHRRQDYRSGRWTYDALSEIDVYLAGFAVACSAAWMFSRGHHTLALASVTYTTVVWIIIGKLWSAGRFENGATFHSVFHHVIPCASLSACILLLRD